LAVDFEFILDLADGLHARPAALVQETAAGFEASILWINRRSGAEADAKSILALIATDTRSGDRCLLRIEGPGAGRAEKALRALLADLPRREAEAAAIPGAAPAARPRLLVLEKTLVFAGAPAAPGIVLGPAAVFRSVPEVASIESPAGSPAEETAAFRQALADLVAELLAARTAAADRTERGILDAHLAIARDRGLAARVEELIAAGGTGAAAAVSRATRILAEPLLASRSAYIRERAGDIRDLARRLAAKLGGTAGPAADIVLTMPAVLVADDLPPSRFLALDRSLLLGLALEKTGPTSHTLILARARGIPAVVGCPGLAERLRDGEDVILDGDRGLLIPSPSEAVGRYYGRAAAFQSRRRERLREAGRKPGRTADGRRLEIAANIGDPEELATAWEAGAEAVGLFRTELLLLGRNEAPGEEEQYAAYSRLARESGGRPIIVRTFDIGGDKPLPFLELPREDNPFLGCRGVRLYGRIPALISAQLRAILRAATLGPLKIMVPMVSAVEEMIGFRALLAAAAADLKAASLPHRAGIEVGMMVEVPSAALAVERFAAHVDFFSVGSNDLLQYFFAADRGNPAVRSVGRPEDPAFLTLLKTIVDGAHRARRRVGLCGELAASTRLLPLLLGLGFDELSLSAAGIPALKARLAALRLDDCRRLVRTSLEQAGPEDVGRMLQTFDRSTATVPLIVPELVRLDSDSRSRAEALQELSFLVEAAERTEDPFEVENAFWRREDTGPTDVGLGVAIPHGKTSAVGVVSVAVLRFPKPFEWSPGGEPVDLAVALLIPDGEGSSEHLKLLARLSRRIVHDEFREALRNAPDPAAAAALVAGALAG
jgi:multiphosphoryl transfer protein